MKNIKTPVKNYSEEQILPLQGEDNLSFDLKEQVLKNFTKITYHYALDRLCNQGRAFKRSHGIRAWQQALHIYPSENKNLSMKYAHYMLKLNRKLSTK